jgi:hypothetical protein
LKSLLNVVISGTMMLLLQYLFGRSSKRNERIIG